MFYILSFRLGAESGLLYVLLRLKCTDCIILLTLMCQNDWQNQLLIVHVLAHIRQMVLLLSSNPLTLKGVKMCILSKSILSSIVSCLLRIFLFDETCRQ